MDSSPVLSGQSGAGGLTAGRDGGGCVKLSNVSISQSVNFSMCQYVTLVCVNEKLLSDVTV